MVKSKRLLSLLLCVILGLMVFSACFDDDKDTSSTTDSTSSEAASEASVEESAESTDASAESAASEDVSAESEASSEASSEETSEEPVVSGKEYEPVNYDLVKAVWISQFDITSIYRLKSEKTFRSKINEIMTYIEDMGFNTIIVQVRPYGDSFYPSELYPLSNYVTSDKSYDENKSYDMLKIMIDEAHKLDISFHAWINPLRLMYSSEIKQISDKYLIKQWYNDKNKNGDYIVESGGRWYLNPAYKEVRQLIIDGAVEICENYDVDAIHMDDYFYPETSRSFDMIAYEDYCEENGKIDLAVFRRENVNKLVRGMYKAIKEVDERILYGISPAGGIDANMDSLYADVYTWCKKDGYIDYICPQIYWAFDNKYRPFIKTVEEWKAIVKNEKVKIIEGLALYKSGTDEGEFGTTDDVIKREVEYLIGRGDSYQGMCIFSYGSLVDSDGKKETENFLPVMAQWK